MLTREDLLLIMRRIGREVVIPESDSFRFEITRKGGGYSNDPEIASLQAKLSIMLEAKGGAQ